VLGQIVDHQSQVDVEAAGGRALLFSGVDGGRPVSGLMRPRIATGVDGRRIEVRWEVDLTG
jgi:hypothetical protein